MGCEGCGWLRRESSGREDTVLLVCNHATLREGETVRVLGEYPKAVKHVGEPRPVWCRGKENAPTDTKERAALGWTRPEDGKQ